MKKIYALILSEIFAGLIFLWFIKLIAFWIRYPESKLIYFNLLIYAALIFILIWKGLHSFLKEKKK